MNNDALRSLERGSIANFLRRQGQDDVFRHKSVIDFGCGQQPYREIIEQAAGQYEGYDRASFPANLSEEDIGEDGILKRDWDVIVNTQTIQYLFPWHVVDWLVAFYTALYVKRGVLLMTGPTSWPLVEKEDICRYTPSGIERLLLEVGFARVEVEPRARFMAGSVEFYCGWEARAWTKVAL